MDPLLSSQTTLLLAMGMSAYVGVLHLWYARRAQSPHGWVALWWPHAATAPWGRS